MNRKKEKEGDWRKIMLAGHSFCSVADACYLLPKS